MRTISGGQTLALAFVLGAVMALGQEPVGLPVLLFLGMTGAVWLMDRTTTLRSQALFGWVLGLGYFAVSLHWIVSPFLVDVPRHGWMAPFALVLLSGGMALFWGLAFGVAGWLGTSRWPLILTWPAVEMLRAYIFTGFPWAMPAQAGVDVLIGQGLAWVGPYGLTLLMVAGAVAVAGAAPAGRLAQTALVLGLALLFLLPPMAGPAPVSEKVIRLVQPNAAQHEKWDPQKMLVFFNRQLSYSAAPPSPGLAPPAAILWPETAIPWTLERAGGALEEISRAANDTPVLMGVLRFDQSRAFNSLVVLGASGQISALYDKHHLVPFGEYMPMADLAARIGLFGLADRAGGGYSAGPGARIIEVAGIGPVLPLICYEAVFAHDVNAAPGRPSLIVQATNDAWFGKAAGPRQHLAQARMRAIEQGVPLARSANTGISAMIDPFGRITASLPLGTAGFIDAPVPLSRPETLYSRSGDLPLAALLFLALGAAALTQRFRNRD